MSRPGFVSRRRRWLLAILTSVGVLACGSARDTPAPLDGGANSDDSGMADGPDGPSVAVDFKSCDLVPGTPGAECAEVTLPATYDNPSSASIEVGIKRIAARAPLKAQIWLVEGGPGGSGVNALAANARSLRTTRRDIELLGADHRGTGGTLPLDCPDQEKDSSEGGAGITEAEWPACLSFLQSKMGDRLATLTTSNSARDLGTLIERLRKPGVPVYVYGISYGSYEVLRYLQFFPKQPDGIVLEGIVPPGSEFDGYDARTNEKGRALFDLCQQDVDCSTHLGRDPWATATSVVASIGAGHCPELGLDADGARVFLGNYLAVYPFRDYLPLLIYRMQRCNAKDVAAIATFYKTVAAFGLSLNDGKAVTLPEFFHVALSEMWHWSGSPTEGAIKAASGKTVISTGLSVRVAERQAGWPVYSRAGITAALPEYTGPMLMLQGKLDPAAPIESARRLQGTYTRPNQTWAELPYGAHAVYAGSPTIDGSDCGEKILFQFVDDPKASLDTSCAQTTIAPRFGGTPSLNTTLLGVADGWDG